MALHQETVVVHQPRTESDESDAKGNAIIIPARDIVLERCNVQPAGTDETIGSDEPVTGRYRVSTYKGDVHEELTEDDTVTWRGDEYTVLGRPGSFHGIRRHTEFVIERTE